MTSRLTLLCGVTALAAMVAGVSCTAAPLSIEVANPADFDRTAEIVEVDASLLPADKDLRILGPDGTEVPYQRTADGKLIFPADVAAGATAVYTVAEGTPAPVDTVATGAFYAERLDDLAWENDRAAYRAYGPALQADGQRAYGYDVWTKSVAHPVVAKRYDGHLHHNISYHEDHGQGMDAYAVGPTLGGGTSAVLLPGDSLSMPWAFESYRIVDNGPLRFTVELTYAPRAIGADSAVRERRVITLDSGSYLNRTAVTYDGLSAGARAAAGVVVHRQNPDAYAIDSVARTATYADLTERADAGNGTIYLALVAPQAARMFYLPMATPAGDALGHMVAEQPYDPAAPMVYYWGSGWSKAGIADRAAWDSITADAARRIAQPLTVTVRK